MNMHLMTLPTASNGSQTMSSQEVAKLTGKEHFNVLIDVRKMLTALEGTALSFQASYRDSTGRSLPCFNLPKRECLILVSGYSVTLRAVIIDRWAELEAQVAGDARIDQPIA